jgi:rRNA maturation RNase YbeY
LKLAARFVSETELPALSHVSISVVLLSDEELLEMNRSSLGHDWYTDIITFEIERSTDALEAELYLSVDRARENAGRAGVSLERELIHLVIHGVLHLAGYEDKAASAKNQMRACERFYLAKL